MHNSKLTLPVCESGSEKELRILSGKEICKIPGKHDFKEAVRRGSHIVIQKAYAGNPLTIPVPDHEEIRIVTLQSIIRTRQL